MEIQFKWIGAACFRMEIDNTFSISCDPCLSPSGTSYDFGFFKSKRIIDPIYQDSDFANIDLWLVTHNHKDHLDENGLGKFRTDSTVVTHKNGYNQLAKVSGNLKVLNWKDETEVKKGDTTVRVKAVPAKHGTNQVSSYLAGGVNGYWLKIDSHGESKNIYVTGDTVWSQHVSRALGNKICDVLIPNMGAVKKDYFGGPLTLDERMLKDMTSQLEPLLVLPVHYGCFSHYDSEGSLTDIHDKRLKLTERGKKYSFTI